MRFLDLIVKSSIALVLVVAGGAKFADTSEFAASIRMFALHLPRSTSLRLASGIAAAEIALGSISLAALGESWVNWAILVLSIGFVIVSAVGWYFYRGRACACFGGLTRRTFDMSSVARSLLIMICAILAERGGWRADDIHLGIASHLMLILLCGAVSATAFTAAKSLALSYESGGA